MKGFKQKTLGRELIYRTVQTVRRDSNPRLKTILRAPTPSESEQYEQDHLISRNSIRRREIAIDNIFDKRYPEESSFDAEDSEDVLEDSGVFFHPGSSSERSDLNLPYIDPEEQIEHEYEGLTLQDPKYWE